MGDYFDKWNPPASPPNPPRWVRGSPGVRVKILVSICVRVKGFGTDSNGFVEEIVVKEQLRNKIFFALCAKTYSRNFLCASRQSNVSENFSALRAKASLNQKKVRIF